MSRTRFEKFNQYLHFNDRSRDVPKGDLTYGPLFKAKAMLDFFQAFCSDFYEPGQSISIDKVMVKFNWRLGFKQ